MTDGFDRVLPEQAYIRALVVFLRAADAAGSRVRVEVFADRRARTVSLSLGKVDEAMLRALSDGLRAHLAGLWQAGRPYIQLELPLAGAAAEHWGAADHRELLAAVGIPAADRRICGNEARALYRVCHRGIGRQSERIGCESPNMRKRSANAKSCSPSRNRTAVVQYIHLKIPLVGAAADHRELLAAVGIRRLWLAEYAETKCGRYIVFAIAE